MTEPAPLSDKALAVFAFAAYHQLESGDVVTSVVATDSAGHRADPAAVEELAARGLAREAEGRLVFSEAGQALLGAVIESLRAVR